MMKLLVALMGLRTDEDGQTFVEYALILAAVVAVAMGVTFTGLGNSLGNAITQVGNAIGS